MFSFKSSIIDKKIVELLFSGSQNQNSIGVYNHFLPRLDCICQFKLVRRAS